jgi:N-acetylglutamate synthase-like GNAT family acetyltransferase
VPVTVANKNDISRLVKLINSAYRGEASKKGWTTEADLLEGDLRTDIPSLTELMNKPGALLLKYTTAEDIISGCVFLEKQERGIYLGMLSVSPMKQATGIGKLIMQAAETHARQNNCSTIFMKVISLRLELIRWYEKQGFHKTDEMQPYTDIKFGTPKQPVEFIVLQKYI